ncbi:MAG: hypothetical protein K9G02_00400 [Microbacteriaceae bacterium]|nr:hypothetical protein [Microbacteriaceae bacterium]
MEKRTLLRALWVSLVSTGLLFVIELIYSGGYPLGVPWGVFVFLTAMSFIAASSVIEGFSRKPKSRFVRFGSILVGLFAVAAWVTLFVDQLPCFFGGKGC